MRYVRAPICWCEHDLRQAFRRSSRPLQACTSCSSLRCFARTSVYHASPTLQNTEEWTRASKDLQHHAAECPSQETSTDGKREVVASRIATATRVFDNLKHGVPNGSNDRQQQLLSHAWMPQGWWLSVIIHLSTQPYELRRQETRDAETITPSTCETYTRPADATHTCASGL